ncbi:DUF1684 domain-containing protein [Flavobacteriaceae bacterium AH-315-B10]|nr:DUF1684 domain-containing protein [Flavobacteriaceae bacterium AH-315-B10]
MKTYLLLFLLVLIVSCESKKTQFNIDDTYIVKFEKNKAKGAQNRINYLQLTGLFKLDSLENTFGKDTLNDFVLSINTLPKTIGTVSILKESIVFSASKNVIIKTNKDSIVKTIPLKLNEFGSSIKLYHNQLNWQVITRSKQRYLRVWDTKNPAIDAFNGFELYELNPNFIFEGQFNYYDKVKTESVNSQLGVNTTTDFIGKVTFSFKNKSYTLDVGKNGFTMVSDETTGDESYGGGRYIYLDLPETDRTVRLDFNYLYNPPCAFSKFTTCLFPPRQNNLPFKILAGEKQFLLKF